MPISPLLWAQLAKTLLNNWDPEFDQKERNAPTEIGLMWGLERLTEIVKDFGIKAEEIGRAHV